VNEEILAAFARIDRTAINADEINGFDREALFVGKCVELLIEAGSFLITATSIYPSGAEGWNRNQAIIGGQLVRMYKLVDAILDQTCKHRLETTFILSRLHFETSVNAIYLMNYPSEKKFDSYVVYSLKHEKRLHEKITKNIEERGGGVLPIEERMLNSIERFLEKSDVTLDEIPSKRMSDWENRNLRQRCADIGAEDAYLSVFSNASISVHGAWGDLLQHHLEYDDGRFRAKTTFKNPRPQSLEVNAVNSAWAVAEYVSFLGLYQEREALNSIFDDFADRVFTLQSAHEAFLQRP